MRASVYHAYIQDPGHQMSATLLPEDVYTLAIESFVIVDVDIAIYSSAGPQALWLAQRRVLPIADWWLIGGRLLAGEREQAGAVRTLARETKLNLAPERFSFIGLKRYLHSERKQAPQSIGCDCLAYTFAIELTAQERQTAARNLDPKEYAVELGLRAFDHQSLQALAQREDEPRAALLHIYEQIFEARRQ